MMPARALEPVNCSISVGSTGMTMPIDRTSSIAVTRTNAIAALLARKATGGMGLDSEVGDVAARRAGARKARPEGGHGRAPARRAGDARGFRRQFRSAWSLFPGEHGAQVSTQARCTHQTPQ